AVGSVIQSRISKRDSFVLLWSVALVLGKPSQFAGYPYPEGSHRREEINKKLANASDPKHFPLYKTYLDNVNKVADQVLSGSLSSPFKNGKQATYMWSADFAEKDPFAGKDAYEFLEEIGGNRFYYEKPKAPKKPQK